MAEDSLLLEPAEDPLLGKLIQEKYRVVKKIGEGGMGAVYLGEHTLINRPVAIKCLHGQFARHPEIVARFQREAMAANAIRHQNIVEVTDLGRLDDGAIFMVLEYLEGRELTDLIEADGALPLGRVVHILKQVCSGLAVAHDKGIIHRDLKPENIYLIERGDDPDFVKVLDFGIAKFRESLGDAITRTGTAMGTPYYMAPEQVKGAKDIDHRADIYSLGVILFHALTGKFPFFEDSFPMLVMKICTTEAPKIRTLRSDLPVGLEELVARMLAKEPSDRPGSCAEVAEALSVWRDVYDAPVPAGQEMPFAQTAYSVPDANAAQPTSEQGGVGPDAAAVPAAAPTSQQGGVGPDAAAVAPGQQTAPAGGAGPGPAPVPAAPSEPGLPTTTPFATDSMAPPRPNHFVSVGLVVALLGIGGLGAFALSGGFGGAAQGDEEGPSETSAAVEPVDPVAPVPGAESDGTDPATDGVSEAVPMIPVAITTVPTDALLFLDGEPVANPYTGELRRSEAAHTIDARAPGYVSQRLTLTPTSAQALSIQLERDRRRPPTGMVGMRAAMNEPDMATAEVVVPAMEAPATMDEPTPTMTGSVEEEGGEFVLQPNLRRPRMFQVRMTD